MAPFGRMFFFLIVTLSLVLPSGRVPVQALVRSSATCATGDLPPTKSFILAPGQVAKLTHDGALLDIGAESLAIPLNITLTPLCQEMLPPLDTGMTNVTKAPRQGYRFLPHMKFKNNLTVTLPYDPTLIPPGLTEQDVKTFYFDEATGSWRELERVAINNQTQTVVSRTDHFTDMINATVTVPDHPETVNFNPTQIKDITAADPGAQVNQIAAPSANAMGDARLTYPIEIPPGRKGMQPQLALLYNSAGGNGWMGLGWDIPMQTIAIDTRWGVPHYDQGRETETYVLNGEQLTPVAHRGELQPRTAEKVFHTRVEGQFRKIIRHGTSPKSYWWEVIDKSGLRSFYGGDPQTNAPATNSTLADDAGNLFLWSLREVRDPNGNFVAYHCVRVSDPGITGGTLSGSNLYLQTITYTGHAGTEGPYTITFVRDRERGEPRRPDVSIDARGGFKRVTADLLRRVDVSLSGQLIRRYEFEYSVGAFRKTLLGRVVQYRSDGVTEFNRHSFSYYDEARDTSGNYRGFEASSQWGVGNDNISAGLFGRGTASVLGGNRSTSVGGHIYIGVGPTGNPSSKSNTAGIKVGYNRSKSEALLTMADMNGDGLPDKVFKASDGFYYRPNRSGPTGRAEFDAPVKLAGLTAISRETVTSTTIGGESYFGLPVLVDHNQATTQADAYFNDVNGDGLTDLVSNGQVLFGYLNAQGQPTFTANSADTPVPIGPGAVDTDGLLEDASAIEAERAANFPLLDTIRQWVAPYDGVVEIDAPVRLIQDTSPERAQYDGADGVRVAIQLEGAELWSTTLAADNYAEQTPSGLGSVPVQRGDRVYFRVQSVFDGAYDRVAWDPEITYLNSDVTRTDVNGLPLYRYRASQDFTLAGRRATLSTPLTGTLRLAGTWEKTGATTDDVTLLITHNGDEVYRRTLSFAETAVVELSQDLAVKPLDELEWRLLVDSPIDVSRIAFSPHAFYISAEGVDDVVDEHGNYILQVSPPYDIDLYPVDALTAPQDHYTASSDGTVPVQARLVVDGLGAGEQTSAVFTVKRRDALLAKRAIDITGTGQGQPVDLTVTADIEVRAGDQLFFDLSSRDIAFASRLSTLEVTLAGVSVPSALHVPAREGLLAQPYRGWNAFGYNGNGSRATQPIDQSVLVIDEHYDSQNPRVFAFVPRADQGLWGGADEAAWVKAGEASASRLGLDDIRVPRSEQFAGAAAVPRISRSTNDSISVGIGASRGSSRSQLDFQDLNGDRFPDVLGQGGVQYTNTSGALESTKRSDVGLGAARESDNESFNASSSGLGTIATAIANARGAVAPSGERPAVTAAQATDMPNLGFGGDVGFGSSDTAYDLIDINGDGLPDKVFENGSAALNLGYRFATPEPWAAGIVNNGESLNAGVNLGFNIDAYSLAGGLNLGIGTTRSDEAYADVNGDGLPDKIIAGSPLSVRLNTGAGFTSPLPWPGGRGRVAVDKHISLGGGAYFTFGFNIPLTPIRIVINPGVNFSTSMGRPEIAFRDVDGDGYADQLFSERDSELQVARNLIGRTNLLRHIERPLGATIDLEYTRDGNTYELPQSRWVLSKVSVFDGLAGDGVDTLLTTLKYAGGVQNRLEREFYGYQTVTEEQRNAAAGGQLYRAITRVYRTDSFYTKGLLVSEVTADAAGHKFVETAHTYLLRDVTTGIEPADPASTLATIFPMLTRTDQRFYEGRATAQKSTHTTHTYDALGNVTQFVDTGDVGAQDDVEAIIGYSASKAACQASYIVGSATSIDVRGNGRLMRHRSATIDCANGNLTQVRQALENGQEAVTDLTYFANGNLQSVIGPPSTSGQRYTLAYVYDPVVATHVTRITDSFGYASSATHNYLFGTIETTTDINNQRTTRVYDSVGREVAITGPYEQGSGEATIRFEYHPEAAVPYALTQHIDKDAAGTLKDPIETLLFIDGLKRVVQTKKDASLYDGPSNAPRRSMIVSGRVTFDHLGRTVEQYYPTSEAKGANAAFNPAYDGITPTRVAYDVLDRNIRTTLPDGTSTSITYGFGADRTGALQFETTITDANGKLKRTYRDVRELITSVKEFNQGATIWTSYAYDALKQIVNVVDDKNNVTSVAYDNLGRRTVIDNPDLGRTETVYDLASNEVAKVTANLRAESKRIAYTYDFNRLMAISYPNFPSNNVTYTYGAPAAPGNAANRITRATSEAGVEQRAYGPLGELVAQTWTIASDTQGSNPEVYTTTYQYDTWNRLMRMTYPDGEVMTYGYDSGGLVTSAQGVKNSHTYEYLTRLEYDKFEQRALIEYGNNIRTVYSYDPHNRRLCGLSTDNGQGALSTACPIVGSGATSNAMQSLAYQYDAVGNLLGVENQIGIAPPSQFGGPVSQRFGYDDLYRLTHAEGSYDFAPSKRRSYTLDMTYDTINNIVSKQQTDVITQPSGTPITQQKTSYNWLYAYGSSRPHAPTHIGDRTFSYDANGNQTGWEHDQNGTRRTIVWDEENRIQSLFDNGHEKTYKYDDDGDRVIKRGPQGETVYVNQYFTIRNREIGTKHVFVGTSRIVSKLMKQDKPGSNPNGNPPLEKDQFFFHPDHLGSSNYITDANGQIYEHLEYFPFGETWVEESTNTQRTPYLFTGKELDEETGLYYFGARYYDPRTSVWQSGDPIFGKYLPQEGEENLSGLGGVYNSSNLGAYSYGHLNPVKVSDPNGKSATLVGALVGGAVGAGIALWRGEDMRHVAGAAVQGAIAGAVVGSVIDTGGASLGVIVAASAGGNVVGGVVGRAISGDQQTVGAAALDAATGAGGALVGAAAGKALTVTAQRLIGPSRAFSTLRPGPYATESIEATGPRVTAAQGREMTRIGTCHTCGTTNAGRASGTFVGDHQPSTGLIIREAEQSLFPHCASCSGLQGAEVRAQNEIWRAQQRIGTAAGASAGIPAATSPTRD